MELLPIAFIVLIFCVYETALVCLVELGSFPQIVDTVLIVAALAPIGFVIVYILAGILAGVISHLQARYKAQIDKERQNHETDQM